ncbi:MAG: TlpA family protein disulfide reductase, partial [Bacteroidales bacterium]|nr:TlpA family protein disulfide reductase [Bacteroidales bacterium]
STDGRFFVAHDYVFAQNLTITYDDMFINFYVSPGDSVCITIDGSKFRQHQSDAVAFSGDNAQINEQLSRWANYASNLKIPQFNPGAPPAEYLNAVEQIFDAMQDTIDAYSKRHEMNDFVKRWALTDYKFIVANHLMDYEGTTGKWSVFTDSIFDIYNERNFQSMYFPYHLYVCIRALFNENDAAMEQRKQGKYNLVLRSVMADLTTKAPPGTVRDMMFYRLASLLLSEKPELYDSIPELDAFFSQAVFAEKLKAAVRKKIADMPKPVLSNGEVMKGISFLAQDSVVALPDIDILPYLIERHKNKVLYIDVWATWCGPCLKAMQYTPYLHEYFAGKELVFINLCLDSAIDSWLQTINKNAIKGENYYFDKDASRFFLGKYNIEGFPTYLLINKAGQKLSSAANPIDTQAVIRQIEACLK